LTTDPAAAIQFQEDPDEKAGGDAKKKISLVDYFYVKVNSLKLCLTVQYNRRLQQPGLPCITVKKNVFLPMEVSLSSFELTVGMRSSVWTTLLA